MVEVYLKKYVQKEEKDVRTLLKKGKDKAKAKLEVRIKDYEAMVKGSSTGGIEFTKPGSLKPS